MPAIQYRVVEVPTPFNSEADRELWLKRMGDEGWRLPELGLIADRAGRWHVRTLGGQELAPHILVTRHLKQAD